MSTFASEWNDTSHGRTVRFVVRYRRDNEGAEVVAFEPTEVAFHCPFLQVIKRRIRIYTNKGRSHIANKIRRSGKLDELVAEIPANPA